jgi:hypothetical protein
MIWMFGIVGFSVVSYSIRFITRSLPFLRELRHLFYVNGIKIIPSFEIIYYLLTPIDLAHWIIGDGLWAGSGVVLCTDSYTIPECVRLINILMIRYGLDSTLRIGKRGNKEFPRIYIKAKSMPLLRTIVFPYMHHSMYYKLGLK